MPVEQFGSSPSIVHEAVRAWALNSNRGKMPYSSVVVLRDTTRGIGQDGLAQSCENVVPKRQFVDFMMGLKSFLESAVFIHS